MASDTDTLQLRRAIGVHVDGVWFSVRLFCGDVAGGELSGFPIHGHADAGASAGVIEEHEFFERAGIELAISSQFESDLRHAVGLA